VAASPARSLTATASSAIIEIVQNFTAELREKVR